MKELQVRSNNRGTVKTIPSYEVAKMMGKEHKEVMWMIEGNEKRGIVGIKPTLEISAELHLSDYVIKSTYKDSMNREKEYYECTKMGCELLANKMTGAKGILFTAKYVKRFNEMEETIKYTTVNDGYITEMDIAKAEISLTEATARLLNLNESSKLAIVTNIYENHGIPTNMLPIYADSSGVIKSATDLLRENEVNISTRAFNKLLVDRGILKECTRKNSKGREKKFKMLSDTQWGENKVHPKCPNQTQPMFYEGKFRELLNLLDI